jgi:hypothetical protein
MVRLAWIFSVAVTLSAFAACGGDDTDGSSNGSTSGSAGGNQTCACTCACCVAIGDCDSPSSLDADDVDECNDDCSAKCNGSYSADFSCS